MSCLLITLRHQDAQTHTLQDWHLQVLWFWSAELFAGCEVEDTERGREGGGERETGCDSERRPLRCLLSPKLFPAGAIIGRSKALCEHVLKEILCVTSNGKYGGLSEKRISTKDISAQQRFRGVTQCGD